MKSFSVSNFSHFCVWNVLRQKYFCNASLQMTLIRYMRYNNKLYSIMYSSQFNHHTSNFDKLNRQFSSWNRFCIHLNVNVCVCVLVYDITAYIITCCVYDKKGSGRFFDTIFVVFSFCFSGFFFFFFLLLFNAMKIPFKLMPHSP